MGGALGLRGFPELDFVQVVKAVDLAEVAATGGFGLARRGCNRHGAKPLGQGSLQLVTQLVFHPLVGAVHVLGIGVQHGGVGPAGCTFLGNHRGNRLLLALERIHHKAPGAGSGNAFALEVVHLHGGIVPVAVCQFLLGAQQFQHRGVLLFVELIRVFDAEFRLLGHQV